MAVSGCWWPDATWTSVCRSYQPFTASAPCCVCWTRRKVCSPWLISAWVMRVSAPWSACWTGPTGSGKSTTLYAALNRVNSSEKNIITIEDPIEYQIKGIGQIQVNSKIDMTFASGLRSILRQDPDIIMVGEIRDTRSEEHTSELQSP